MEKAPDSYLDCKRPPIQEALRLEGLSSNMTIREASDLLQKKGYFTARPRPWKLGFRNRGHGRGDYAVLDKFEDVVVEVENRSDADLIISAVNTHFEDLIKFLEEEVIQLDKWANETRVPMGQLTLLGEEMMTRANVVRAKIESLRAGVE